MSSRLVLETLEPLPGDRKSFRMINGVLVEGTVREAVPALRTNSEGLTKVLDDLLRQYQKRQAEMERWKVSEASRVLVRGPCPGLNEMGVENKPRSNPTVLTSFRHLLSFYFFPFYFFPFYFFSLVLELGYRRPGQVDLRRWPNGELHLYPIAYLANF